MGSGPHSNVLDWLQLYGYYHLSATDVLFRRRTKRGSIEYVGDDLRKTRFADQSIDCIMCQSALEHGIDQTSFFREATRLLRPNGYLLVSTDFWPEKIDTRGLILYGVPWKVFSEEEIRSFVEEAKENRLELMTPVDLTVGRPMISLYDKMYTFIFLGFRKMNRKKTL